MDTVSLRFPFPALRHGGLRKTSVGDPNVPTERNSAARVGKSFQPSQTVSAEIRLRPVNATQQRLLQNPFKIQSRNIGQGWPAKLKQGDFLLKSEL